MSIQNNRSGTETADVEQDNGEQRPKPDIRLSDLPGVIAAIVLVFIIAISYVAHYYVNEHSASIKFAVEATFSFLALLVIIAQAVIYAQQARFMKQQVSIAKIAERGYVHIEDMRLVAPLAVGPLPNVRIIFRNAGRTPGYSFISTVRPIYHSGSLREAMTDFPLTSYPAQGDRFIPASAKQRVEFSHPKFILTATHLDLIRARTFKLYVVGEARYIDFEGTEQSLPIRAIFDPDDQGFSEVGISQNARSPQ